VFLPVWSQSHTDEWCRATTARKGVVPVALVNRVSCCSFAATLDVEILINVYLKLLVGAGKWPRFQSCR
jgi:hypothetical protein